MRKGGVAVKRSSENRALFNALSSLQLQLLYPLAVVSPSLLSLTSGVSGLCGLEKPARMGSHSQTVTARCLMLHESLLLCTDEVIPCTQV
jgi:hypothetical protein